MYEYYFVEPMTCLGMPVGFGLANIGSPGLARNFHTNYHKLANEALQSKYTSPVTDEYARRRLSRILDTTTQRLMGQEDNGSRYFKSDRLTAPDIYWAALGNLFEPIQEELCTIPDSYRSLRAVVNAFLAAPLPQILLEHRDYVVRKHFRIPITL